MAPAKVFGYGVLVVAACISLVFVEQLKPSSLGARAFFTFWLLLPYIALAVGLMFLKERIWATAGVIVAVLAAVGGLLFLSNVIFLRSDPQGAIAVFFTPVYQAIGIAILLPLCHSLFAARMKKQ